MRVPFFQSPWRSDKAAASRLIEVLSSGTYVAGEEVAAFESEFSDWLGGREVVGVNSGTDALFLALTSLGISQGDEVVLPSYTFIACLEAVVRVGAVPVLVDSMPGGFLPGLEQIGPVVNSATRAILAVPLFGDTTCQPELHAFCRQRGLLLIEDAAQACGGYIADENGNHRVVGTLGAASAFSFYPTKTLGAAGDSGAVSFRDPAHAERCRALKNHGMVHDEHREIGINSRLDALQAALLRIGLRNLGAALRRRSEIAERYIRAMSDLPLLRPPVRSFGHAWNYFVLRHPHRDHLRLRLADLGVETRIYYSRPIHREPAYLRRYPALRLPNCEQLAEQSLAVPLYPTLTTGQIDHVVDSVVRACRGLALQA
jgi:dTDP-4-amino-4,6-dideoxygalactose transaminase